MNQTLILIGGGEQALVVGETAQSAGWQVLGLIAPPGETLPWPRLGEDADLPAILAIHPQAGCILALGDLARRRALVQRLPGLPWVSVMHPTAVISPSAEIGIGTWIGPLAVVNGRSRLGRHVMINSAAVVEHDCQLHDHVHLAPGAVLGGRVLLGEAVFVGLGARIRDGRTVGAQAIIGMGAVVVTDVMAKTTVMGIPAREATCR